MEEPSEEDWEIREYLSESNSNKASWIWSKGLVLGKKVLATGIVISSAPFVLPPLAVVSILGVAVSIPYGLFFGSYACSEKLLNKLLPGTSPSLFLDYDSTLSDEEAEETDRGYWGDIFMDGEKSEEAQDIKEEREIGIEMVGGNGEEKAMDGYNYDKRGNEDLKDLILEIGKIVEENGSKPTTHESVLRPREGEMQGVLLNIEVDENGNMPSTQESVLKPPNDEMQGVLLNMEVGEKDGDKFGEIGVPLEVANVTVLESVKLQKMRDDELVRETRALIENFADGGKALNAVKEDKTDSQDMHRHNDHMDLPIEAKNLGIKGKKKGKSKKDKAEEKRIKNEKKKATRKEIEKRSAIDEKQKTIPKSEEAKRLTEGAPEGTLQPKVMDNGDVMSATFLAPFGLNQERPHQNLAEKGISLTFHEEIYGEEKIWQKIEAMRKIVGYKATRQASCIEELKALYVFTGVEPPASFEDAPDLKEVNDKLRFLMSVVGVM